MKIYPTKEQLEQLFIYEPDTGLLKNRINRKASKAGQIAGYIDNGGYYSVRIKNVVYKAHRLVMIMNDYTINQGEEVDHIDHCGTNNRLSNLRIVSHKTNLRNQKIRKTNTSGVMGISFDKKHNKWDAYIYNDKLIHLGLFTDKEDAINARKRAEIVYDYSANHGCK
jgi:hypothetical protein